MLTRIMLEQTYKTNEMGLIVNDVSFEGSYLYVPYFWDLAENGEDISHTTDRTEYTFFELTDKEIELFPELEGMFSLTLYKDTNNYIHCLFRNYCFYEVVEFTNETDNYMIGR